MCYSSQTTERMFILFIAQCDKLNLNLLSRFLPSVPLLLFSSSTFSHVPQFPSPVFILQLGTPFEKSAVANMLICLVVVVVVVVLMAHVNHTNTEQ